MKTDEMGFHVIMNLLFPALDFIAHIQLASTKLSLCFPYQEQITLVCFSRRRIFLRLLIIFSQGLCEVLTSPAGITSANL